MGPCNGVHTEVSMQLFARTLSIELCIVLPLLRLRMRSNLALKPGLGTLLSIALPLLRLGLCIDLAGRASLARFIHCPHSKAQRLLPSKGRSQLARGPTLPVAAC